MTLSPCLECGEPADTTRCSECASEHRRAQHDRKSPPAARGYDAAWNRLSMRARRLQPFCSDCGATTDLQADHSPEAWERKAAGLPLRLRDIDVVCGYHNRQRGAQRPNQTPPGGIPAGQSPETHSQESNFASHTLGSRAEG